MRYLGIFIVISMFLSGCTSNSSFDCPNKAGVNCRSLDQINSMVNSGEIGNSTAQTITLKDANANDTNFQSFPSFNSYLAGQPIRYGETVQRIWLAPYEDTEGNYHEDTLIYTVVKNGHWIGNPVKAIQET